MTQTRRLGRTLLGHKHQFVLQNVLDKGKAKANAGIEKHFEYPKNARHIIAEHFFAKLKLDREDEWSKS